MYAHDARIANRYPTVTIGRWRYLVDRVGLVDRNRELGEPPIRSEIKAACEWLKQRASAGMVRMPSLSCYEAKHAASRWGGKYVSNGAFIIACQRCGFELRPVVGWRDCVVNCRVGISLRHFKTLAESLQPTDDRDTGKVEWVPIFGQCLIHSQMRGGVA